MSCGHIVAYGQREIDYLSKKDKKLGAAIARIGIIERERTPDLFAAMVRNIIAQQISGKAARTVTQRLIEKAGEVTPARILAISTEEIQRCGMSLRKAGYIHSIADAASAGALDNLIDMPDEQVINQLVKLPGIGVWSAEMLLIFSLGRLDVLSYGDLAIRRGIQRLYGLKSEPTREQFSRYRKRYSPYGSVASLYLWHISGE